MATTEQVAEQARPGFVASALAAARRLAPITLAGALLGVVVGGVGGRLAMLLLARLNPAATGVESDDGFVMGQFTVANSLRLLLTGMLAGLIGAAVYYAVRGLRFGPRWFQITSFAVGGGVTVGALIVHPDGVDFTLLSPAWLAIALFVAIPALYAGLLTVIAERLLDERSRWWGLPRLVRYAPVGLLGFVPFLVPILASGWIIGYLVRSTPSGRVALERPQAYWFGRLVLVGYFGLALRELIADTVAIA
jgi:hypothetical protein